MAPKPKHSRRATGRGGEPPAASAPAVKEASSGSLGSRGSDGRGDSRARAGDFPGDSPAGSLGATGSLRSRAVTDFREEFRRGEDRCKFLVASGQSHVGKTQFARELRGPEGEALRGLTAWRGAMEEQVLEDADGDDLQR